MSEALILASTNPQYDNRLFIELPVLYMKIPSWEHVVYTNVFFCFRFDIQNNLLIFIYRTHNSMNNLLRYCGSVDARISASEKDLCTCRDGHFFYLSQTTDT